MNLRRPSAGRPRNQLAAANRLADAMDKVVSSVAAAAAAEIAAAGSEM